MKRTKLLSVIFFLICINYAVGQHLIKNRFGVGFSYDNINGGGNLIFQFVTLQGHVTLNTELSSLRYGNTAVGINGNYYPLPEKRLSPFIGITGTRSFGGEASYDEGLSNGRYLAFQVSPASYLTPFLGCKYDITGGLNGKGEPTNNCVTFFLKFGYKFNIGTDPTVIHIGGIDADNKYQKITNYIDSGFAYSFGFLYCW